MLILDREEVSKVSNQSRGPTQVKMSLGARLYLSAFSLMSAAMAFGCARPELWTSGSYDVIKEFGNSVLPSDNPLEIWMYVFLLTAVLCAFAASAGAELTARISLTLGSATLVAWTVSFIISYARGDLLGFSGPVIWGAFAICNYIQSADPMVTVFAHLNRLKVTTDK